MVGKVLSRRCPICWDETEHVVVAVIKSGLVIKCAQCGEVHLDRQGQGPLCNVHGSGLVSDAR